MRDFLATLEVTNPSKRDRILTYIKADTDAIVQQSDLQAYHLAERAKNYTQISNLCVHEHDKKTLLDLAISDLEQAVVLAEAPKHKRLYLSKLNNARLSNGLPAEMDIKENQDSSNNFQPEMDLLKGNAEQDSNSSQLENDVLESLKKATISFFITKQTDLENPNDSENTFQRWLNHIQDEPNLFNLASNLSKLDTAEKRTLGEHLIAIHKKTKKWQLGDPKTRGSLLKILAPLVEKFVQLVSYIFRNPSQEEKLETEVPELVDQIKQIKPKK